MTDFLSTDGLAKALRQPAWRIRRLFEDGDLAEVDRFAGKRAIPRAMIPDVIDALRRRGWIDELKGEAATA